MYNVKSVSQDDSEDPPSMTVITKCLREAGSYDGSMTEKQMLELYNVLNDSKTTAIAEDEQRRSAADDNSNYSLVDEMRLNSIPVESAEALHLDDSDLSLLSTPGKVENVSLTKRRPTVEDSHSKMDNFDEINVLDSVPTKHPPLSEISYKPKYDPPLYCQPNFIRLSLDERKRLLSEYHDKLIRIYDSFHRRSTHYAILDKPIQPDIKFDGSLLRSPEKVANYSFDDEDIILEQNNNSDDIYITKTGRQTKRKLYTETKESFKSKMPKRTSISPLSNDQIMKRSKLFNMSKSEKLFEKLQEKAEQEKREEKENLNFVNSLKNDSDDEFEDDVAELVHSDEPFIRRRVTPPSRAKKPARGGSRTAKSKNDRKVAPNPKEIQAPEPPAAIDKAVCPMCNLEFPQDKLETHANRCIDTYEEKISFNNSSKMITCENCDQVLPLSMDYEIHVRDCLAKLT